MLVGNNERWRGAVLAVMELFELFAFRGSTDAQIFHLIFVNNDTNFDLVLIENTYNSKENAAEETLGKNLGLNVTWLSDTQYKSERNITEKFHYDAIFTNDLLQL